MAPKMAQKPPPAAAPDAAASNRPQARVPRGMRDIGPAEIRSLERMLATIRGVYDSYGYEPLDTPAFE